MVNRKTELEKYSFPVEGVEDADICKVLHLEQPLQTITFKAPQLLAYHFAKEHPRFILSFDKGMGKTITYLTALHDAGESSAERLLIVCSENAKPAQRREIERHFTRWKQKWVYVEGSAAERKKRWNGDYEVFICTYDTLLADMGQRAKSSSIRVCPAWVDAPSTAMAFDEWHKKLRNKSSGIFKMLKGFKNTRMIFSSGSAGGKGVHSMWPVLHLCDRIKFSAYWPYVMRHAVITESYFGKKIEGCKDVPLWRKVVAPYIFHRRKDLKDYPIKTRQSLTVRMEPWQKKAHDQLLRQLFLDLPDGEIFASPNVLAATMKLRQFMVCPKVISPEYGWGAALEGIWNDIDESELTHFVVSTPFRDPIPLIEQFFQSKGLHTERLMGGDGCDADEIERRIASWTKKGGVMIQTIHFAESYELPAARVMYMLGYLHDHEQNMQAEDRIHRDIRVTPHPVDIYYVKSEHSYDEDVIEALANNADNIHALMHRPIKEFMLDD